MTTQPDPNYDDRLFKAVGQLLNTQHHFGVNVAHGSLAAIAAQHLVLPDDVADTAMLPPIDTVPLETRQLHNCVLYFEPAAGSC